MLNQMTEYKTPRISWLRAGRSAWLTVFDGCSGDDIPVTLHLILHYPCQPAKMSVEPCILRIHAVSASSTTQGLLVNMTMFYTG
jgi:hypothetical protein